MKTDELQQIGRYQIKEKVGQGAMGVVYRAFDPNLDIDVAIKVLRSEMAEDEQFVQRFLQEAKVIARLTHPNIVHIYNTDEDHGVFYIAMTFLDGKPLDQYLKEAEPDLSRVIDIAVQIAEALDYAHKNKIFHRDIKPSNIIISPEDHVILTDFGVAHFEDTPLAVKTMAGDSMGTPLYMSPEQFKGVNVDGRSDLYALGIILYEITTGKLPFLPFDRTISPTPPVEINPAIPRDLSRLIMKSLHYKQTKRFQTGEDLANALKSINTENKNLSLLNKQKTGFVKKTEIPGQTEAASDSDILSAKLARKKIQNRILIFGGVLICIAAGVVFFRPVQQPEQKPEPQIILRKGTLKIETIPPGASIVIDDNIKGKASAQFSLPVGTHEVRLSLDNYYESNVVVFVNEGETPLLYPMISIDNEKW